MAYVSSLLPGVRKASRHPSSVKAEFQYLQDAEGAWLFQIATFGSEDRKSGQKVSQTLQFDEERAFELVNALRAVFPRVGSQ